MSSSLPPGVEKIVSPRGKVIYEVRLSFGSPPNRSQPEQRFTTAREARDWRAEQITLHSKGIAVAPAHLTVEAAVADWLASRRVRPTTLVAYTASLAPVVEMYGDRRVQKITKKDVEKLVTALQDGNRPAACGHGPPSTRCSGIGRRSGKTWWVRVFLGVT